MNIVRKADVIYSNCVMFYAETVKILVDNYKGILIHNNNSYRSMNKIEIQSSWSKTPQRYYKLNTNTKR